MKKYILMILCFVPGLMLRAQNLVPNSSFENYVACPTGYSGIPYPSNPAFSVLDWYVPTMGSSDYFNSCSSSILVAVPDNSFGHQFARTGNGYGGGFLLLGTTAYREYLQTKLLSPLVAGHRYFVGYWVSSADAYSSYQTVGIDQLGVLFYPDSIQIMNSNLSLIGYGPQLVSPAGVPITETADWINISADYVATGNERWMILGNFEPYSALTIAPIQGSSASQMAYYYYDDVCVLDLDGTPGAYSVSDTSLCPGDHVLITAGDGLQSYLWNDGDTSRQRTISDTGTYWVKSIDKANCSFKIDSFYVHLKGADAEVNLGEDTFMCAGLPFTLNAYDDAFLAYQWNTGSEDPAIQVDAPGLYYVSARLECYSVSDTILVAGIPKPQVALPGDTLLCDGDPLLLSSEQPGMSYSWNTGSDKCCIEVTQSGTYTLTVANICGEQAADSISVLYSGCDHCLLIPTAFSPNGDGLNDRFTVFNNCMLSTFKLSIYNRFGQLVFSGFDPEDGWDGTYRGMPAEAGVYFYHVEASPRIPSLPDIKASGDITLIR